MAQGSWPKALAFVLLCGSAAVAGLAQQAPPRDASVQRTGTGNIRGRVFADDTGAGLRNARVQVTSDAGPAAVGFTDSNGRFVVPSLAAVDTASPPPSPATSRRVSAPSGSEGLYGQTPDIHYVPTSEAVAEAMLQAANVTPRDVVYDLGSGDGRIVILAAKKFGARGVGIELDSELIKQSNRNAQKAGVADKVRFVQGDLFKSDLSEATVVALYLSQSTNLRLEPKLKRELKPGARVVSHRFEMPADWKPDKDLSVHGTRVYVWTIR